MGFFTQGKIRTQSHHHCNQHAPTNKKHHSRSIYGRHSPIRYFPIASLKPRPENRCYCVLFFRHARKMKTWHIVIRWFEFSRFNPLTLCFILIIFIDYLYIKRAKLVQLAKDGDCNIQDLGSNPRSILFPILFCKLCSHVILVLRRTICLPHPSVHVSITFRSKA